MTFEGATKIESSGSINALERDRLASFGHCSARKRRSNLAIGGGRAGGVGEDETDLLAKCSLNQHLAGPLRRRCPTRRSSLPGQQRVRRPDARFCDFMTHQFEHISIACDHTAGS